MVLGNGYCSNENLFIRNTIFYESLSLKKFIFRSISEISRSSIYQSLINIPQEKLELPVFEDTQMGMTLGLALEGFPISCFPRFDFVLLGLNQLVNHMDKIDYLTNKKLIQKYI